MATIRHHARIERSPEAVWEVVSDAGTIYRIIGGDMPVEFHLGTIDVLPDRDGALVVYSTDLGPDELRGQMDGVIADGLDGLRARLEA